MYTVFLWFYALMLCMSAMLLYVDSVVDTVLVSPFDLSNMTTVALPNINNGSNSLILNTTSAVLNATSGNPFSFLTDSLFYSLQVLRNVIDFLTGQFVWQMIASFGLPTIFVQGLQVVIAFFLVLTIIHFWTGRV